MRRKGSKTSAARYQPPPDSRPPRSISIRTLPSPRKAVSQEFRQPRRQNLGGGPLDVVFHPEPLEDTPLPIQNHVRTSRISVTRLPHASNVGEIPESFLQFQGFRRFYVN